ncbi:MAG: hypothetical protein EZS28_048543, partial [Streblomastix strix]
MTASNNQKKTSAMRASSAEQFSGQSTAQALNQDSERIFRNSIENIKSGNFTDDNTQENVLKQILCLLVSRVQFPLST